MCGAREVLPRTRGGTEGNCRCGATAYPARAYGISTNATAVRNCRASATTGRSAQRYIVPSIVTKLLFCLSGPGISVGSLGTVQLEKGNPRSAGPATAISINSRDLGAGDDKRPPLGIGPLLERGKAAVVEAMDPLVHHCRVAADAVGDLDHWPAALRRRADIAGARHAQGRIP